MYEGQWFHGLQNNSVKVMDTCGQQSSVNGIEVILIQINSYLTLFPIIFIEYQTKCIKFLKFYPRTITHEKYYKSDILL